MNTRINARHTLIQISNDKVDVSLFKADKIEARGRDGYVWIEFSYDNKEATVHLSEENLPQLKEAVRQIEQFYAKEVPV